MQGPERGPGVHAQLVTQELPGALEGGQGLRPAARTEQREHELLVQPLPQRVLVHGCPDLGRQVGPPADLQFEFENLLQGSQPRFLQPITLELEEGSADTRQRRAVPRAQGLTQELGGARRGVGATRPLGPGGQLPELLQVDGSATDRQTIAVAGRFDDRQVAEDRAQTIDVGADGAPGASGPVLTPQGLHDRFGRHRAPFVQEQQCEQSSLLWGTEVDLLVLPPRTHGTENRKTHHATAPYLFRHPPRSAVRQAAAASASFTAAKPSACGTTGRYPSSFTALSVRSVHDCPTNHRAGTGTTSAAVSASMSGRGASTP